MRKSLARRKILEVLGAEFRSFKVVSDATDPVTGWVVLQELVADGLVKRLHERLHFRLTQEGLDIKAHPTIKKNPLPESLTQFCKNPHAKIKANAPE